ncbi:MAG: prolyl oligopeptidase family serine peptidase [Steroidobacteraceae bacterium]
MSCKPATRGQRPRANARAIICAFALSLAALAPREALPADVQRIVATHPGSTAQWIIEKPSNWNGTVLLYAHGYAPSVSSAVPESAPRGARDWLLARGYALAASAYTAGGWALAEAPGDQMQVLDEFVKRVAQPRRTIAWGSSMGGMVTLALAERHPDRIQGALPLCGSVSGSLGMLNTALDGAFAFRTLVAPDSGIRIVGVDDDRANSARVATALQTAWNTPAGKARVVLAAALAQLPDWTDPASPRPTAAEFDARAEQLRRGFAMGVFVPRVDQEQRAGGVNGWNTGVDYRRVLRESPLRRLVEHFYREAGIDLQADLAKLNAAPRIEADAKAVAYMRANFVPRGNWRIPVLTLQAIGDGVTVPTTHAALGMLSAKAGRNHMVGQLWVERAGHCIFTPAELAAALATLENRLDTGRWSLEPAQVNARGGDAGGDTRFIPYTPSHMPRLCGAQPGSCPGEPQPAGQVVPAKAAR